MSARKGATAAINRNQVRSELPGTYRARLVELLPSGELVVRLEGPGAGRGAVVCDFLETTGAEAPSLKTGDAVLVVMPDGGSGKPTVVGKIGAYRAPNRRHLVLEADDELTIRCGQATIAFRKDGKILIKGAEIVSHARGRNRIRGGSIQIN